MEVNCSTISSKSNGLMRREAVSTQLSSFWRLNIYMSLMWYIGMLSRLIISLLIFPKLISEKLEVI